MEKKSKVIAPIIIFTEEEFDKLKITNELFIRKITESEINKYFRVNAVTFKKQRATQISPQLPGIKLWDDLPKGLESLELIDSSIPYYVLEGTSNANIVDFIFTLHLFKRGAFFCPQGQELTPNGDCNYFYRPFNFQSKYNYIIKPTEYQILIEIYKRVSKFNDKKNDIIRRRLSTCFDYNQNNYIKFIESVSVIESILCGNDMGELRFRFSLYSSFILKKIGYDSHVNAKYMGQFYDIRSKLVHAGKAKEYSNKLLAEIVDITKLIYIEYIKTKMDGDKILIEIEDCLEQMTKKDN